MKVLHSVPVTTLVFLIWHYSCVAKSKGLLQGLWIWGLLDACAIASVMPGRYRN